jgi:hypothetical protein
MGASGWVEFVEYEADFGEGLWKARRGVFEAGRYQAPAGAEGVDLEGLSDDDVKAMMAEAVGLPVEYIDEMEGMAPGGVGAPRPRDELDERIGRMLALTMDSGSHSILDMVRVGDERGLGVVTPVRDEELERIVGTSRPTRGDVEEHVEALLGLRDRWEGSVVVVYGDDGAPTELCFLGFSGD